MRNLKKKQAAEGKPCVHFLTGLVAKNTFFNKLSVTQCVLRLTHSTAKLLLLQFCKLPTVQALSGELPKLVWLLMTVGQLVSQTGRIIIQPVEISDGSLDCVLYLLGKGSKTPGTEKFRQGGSPPPLPP